MATSAKHLGINHDSEPVRLFQSDFVEFFTHISPLVVLLIWLPVAVCALWRGILAASQGASSVLTIVLGWVVGLFLWTPTEYLLHRFVFHFPPRNQWQERVSFLFHGVHHYQPKCKTRLVMPPVVSIPLAALFYGLFWLIVGQLLGQPHWLGPLFSGFIVGYLVYDMTHYATHHLPMRRRLPKFLKRHHMQHHYKTPNARFGVSSPLWDMVLGTMPAGDKS